MKIKSILSLLLSVCLLSACAADVVPGGVAPQQTAVTTAQTTVTVAQTTVTTPEPQLTTGAPVTDPVPETTDAPETTTSTTAAPTTNAPTTNAPTTNAPTTNAPTTNAPTTNKPTTTQPPVTEPKPETKPVLEEMSVPSTFSSLVSSYGTLYQPWGSAAKETLAYTLRTALSPIEYENQKRLTASGRIKLDGFLVSLLLGMSSLDFELDYLTDGYDTKNYSKLTTSAGKISETDQVYIDRWMYCTETETAKNGSSTVDQYKVWMTADEFSSNALNGMDKLLYDLSGLVEVVDTAGQSVLAMTESGEIVIMITDLDKALIEVFFSSLGSVGDVIAPESFQQMKIIMVIDENHVLREIVVDMPLTLSISGMSVKGSLSLRAQIELPETVTITVPENGQNYPERTISEAFDDSDDSIFGGILGGIL